MNFASDNTAGCAPEIMAGLARASTSAAMGYGADPVTNDLGRRFAELFGSDVTVFPIATGTAANALALSAVVPPFGGVICLDQSHVYEDECGAPEFFAGGARLIAVRGTSGKMCPSDIDAVMRLHSAQNMHRMQPAAVSITQMGEGGEIYTVDEIEALGAAARRHQLALHMDGARFANAIAALNCRPADVTWRAGVDLLSFGATKNGCWAAEAVVVMKPELAATLLHRRKRAGHTLSKMRLLSAQLEAYLEGDLWLRFARHANAMMGRLAAGLAAVSDVRLMAAPRGNLVFANLPAYFVAPLERAGFVFYHWGTEAYHTCRFVTSFNTDPAHIERFLAIVLKESRGKPPAHEMPFLPRP